MTQEFDTVIEAMRVLQRARWTLFGVWALLICSTAFNVVQYSTWKDSEAQIEYLEEYIRDNSWPVVNELLPQIEIEIKRK